MRRWARQRPAEEDSGRPFFTKDYPELEKYRIGDFTYGRPRVRDYDAGSTLSIGRFCSIAADVIILVGGEHNLKALSTYPFQTLGYTAPPAGHDGDSLSKGDVVIGNDVWVGNGALILSGVRVGNGASIGAGSVVTKDIADYEIVAGNPARHLRFRFEEPIIAELLEVRWWELDIDELRPLLPSMMSGDVATFVQMARAVREPAVSSPSS